MADIPLNANFNGVNFRVLLSGAALGQEAEVSIRHIPGGDADFIDVGGRKTGTYAAECFFADSGAFGSMVGQVGSRGTFNDGHDSYEAVLTKVTRKKAFGSAPFHFATAEFIVIN